jgi:hypothetical protein
MLSNIIYNMSQNNSFPLEAPENRRYSSLDKDEECALYWKKVKMILF